MLKILNGKKYNTETAKLICHANNGRCLNDYFYASETLYVKKTGEFFLEIENAGISDEFYHIDNKLIKDDIMPISKKFAKKWLAKHGADKCEEIFGKVAE